MNKFVSSMNDELSQKFFDIVFRDEFIFAEAFGADRASILKKSKLTRFEKELAERIADSELYSEDNWDACDALCQDLSLIYNWQSNSEGPAIFASKILYLLRDQGKDVSWFKEQLFKPTQTSTRKKIRATVIVETPSGLMITKSHKGEWLLPGGGKNRGELSISAAVRELYEETKIEVTDIAFLFDHESRYYTHHVFLVRNFKGTPRPSSDAVELQYIQFTDVNEAQLPENLSRSNLEIIRRFVDGY